MRSRLLAVAALLVVGCVAAFALTSRVAPGQARAASPEDAAPAPAPAPAPKTPDAKPPTPARVDRSPQLGVGTFTIFEIMNATEVPVAWAARAPDGLELWLFRPGWNEPSSSNPDVTWRVRYESAATPTQPADLFAWVCAQPAYRPYVHGKNVRAVAHDTTVLWDGSVARACSGN